MYDSATTSFVLFIINLISCISLYVIGDNEYDNEKKAVSIYFFSVGIMQFHDWILWKSQNTRDSDQEFVNYIFTRIACVSSYADPLVLYTVVHIFLQTPDYFSDLVIRFYIICSVYYILQVWNEIYYTKVFTSYPVGLTYIGSSGLVWEWNEKLHRTNNDLLHIFTTAYLLVFNFSFIYSVRLISLAMILLYLSDLSYRRQFKIRLFYKLFNLVPTFLIVFT
jgi:hypothetical protein